MTKNGRGFQKFAARKRAHSTENLPFSNPRSATALIGENTQFHCAAIGADIIAAWKVDDLFATDIRITDRAIFHTTPVTASGTIQSSLTVPATIENNGTTVQCVLYPGEVTSSNATLTVLPGEL